MTRAGQRYEEIKLSVDDGVATLALAAPETRNALTIGMTREIYEACDAIDADPAIACVVIRGEGGYFCSGASRARLDEVLAAPADGEAVADIRYWYGVFRRVGSLRCPSIAAVRGGAFGGGFNLALSTDVRILGLDAVLQSAFAHSVGIHPGGGHFALLNRYCGVQAACAIGIFGEPIDGRRAEAVGLAWAAVDDGEVEPLADSLARRISARPYLARSMIASVRAQVGPPVLTWDEAADVERAAQADSMRHRDGRGPGEHEGANL
jgi:enoyl-CoA hydratase